MYDIIIGPYGHIKAYKIIILFCLVLFIATSCQNEQKEEGYRPPALSAEKKQALQFFENEDYATDGQSIYINAYDGASSWADNYQLVKDVDAETFSILEHQKSEEIYFGDPYFRDKNHVYYNGRMTYEIDRNIKILENIDPKTAIAVSTHCAKDATSVYCDIPYQKMEKEIRMKKVTGADPGTFMMIGGEAYFKDKNAIFCNQTDKTINIQKLEVADPDTFELMSDGFAKDKNNVFSGCTLVEDADSR